MRPKKVLLLVLANEVERSLLTFMLTTNGYRVLRAGTGPEAVPLFTKNEVDLVLADFALPKVNGAELVAKLKEVKGHIPMMLLGDLATDVHHFADAMLSKKHCTHQELLERIKVMSARKRGPRKGTLRSIQPVPEPLAPPRAAAR
jgi:CheY-like chemotaxis protein